MGWVEWSRWWVIDRLVWGEGLGELERGLGSSLVSVLD
jgi:hypothetical protein